MRRKDATAQLILGIGVVALIVTGLAVLDATSSRDSPSPTATRGVDLPGSCGGKTLTLAEASTVVPFQILVPDHALAREDDLVSVEWCDPSDVLVLSYESGVRVELSPSQLANPEEEFQQQAEEYAGTRVGTIRGLPALFVEPGSKDASSIEAAPGGVEFVEGKLLVDVVGDGTIGLQDLRAVTETMTPYEQSI